MSMSSPERSTRQRELRVPRDWEERVARQVDLQSRIEAAFDKADAYGRVGRFALALEWLDLASTLSGGLPPEYRLRRARYARKLQRERR
jgi:hypothetical protein